MTLVRFLPSLLVAAALLLTACANKPPERADNICYIFEEYPRWYDHARRAEQRWGTPIPVQIAFVHQESGFRHNVRPPREYLFGFIPQRRPSSAYGYAQAITPAWSDYREATGRHNARRTNMAHALDFIGWYNDISHRRLNIPPYDAERLYLAYHEGHTGYARGAYRHKPQVQQIARRVSRRAQNYAAQLEACESRLRCRRFYQFWPFCR